MTFEFILLALIQNEMPVEVSRYEDTVPLYCLEDASKLNAYIANNYVFKNNLELAKNYFIKKLDEYEGKYGPFPNYVPKALNLSTPEADDFYTNVLVSLSPVSSIDRNETMSSEQNMLFYIVASSYKNYVDETKENERHQIFQDILDNNEIEDTSTMLTSSQVQYVCLPVPK